jgi:hypothetical protein
VLIQLHNPQQGHAAILEAWPKIKGQLQAGKKINLEIKQATRSSEQNMMFHSLIGKIYKAMAAAGSTWGEEDWKRLLIDQWAHETGRKIGRVVPSLDGERVVQLGLQSHKFTVEDTTEFIEFLLAWGAQRGIEL